MKLRSPLLAVIEFLFPVDAVLYAFLFAAHPSTASMTPADVSSDPRVPLKVVLAMHAARSIDMDLPVHSMLDQHPIRFAHRVRHQT